MNKYEQEAVKQFMDIVREAIGHEVPEEQERILKRCCDALEERLAPDFSMLPPE